MLASLATIMKEKTALVTSLVYFALTIEKRQQNWLRFGTGTAAFYIIHYRLTAFYRTVRSVS